MKVILTHNHADFDAVASLLAKHKLEPDAVPVLPQQVNSNVADFLAGFEWPFVQSTDGSPIDMAFVVAAQSVDLLHGMSHKTPQHITDHEPPNVTHLIETIMARGMNIKSHEATLMLLAISDETGHLLFAGADDLRAAAWLLDQNADVDAVRALMWPSVYVDALMSWGVQTVASDVTVREAHNAMLESGHEGYPVLDDGKLVGLLTRRAVDRAVLHELGDLHVTEVMEAGKHAVRSSDSVDLLKERMLATGWGQMPVVDRDGALVGVVTRTDLIKHWGQAPQEVDRHHQILDTMRAMFAPEVWELLESISQTAQAQNKGLYLVGGIVRDLLLERQNLDIDLVVEGNAIELARTLANQYGGSIQQHKQFGTAKWKFDDNWDAAVFPESIDFATARAEFYEAPTVLPTVRSGSIKLDLHRRDFTINALAIRLAPAPMGHLLDFYNGERDLRDGLVRVLHSLSFIDDPTRMLRAARFEQRFGFTIEARTEELLRGALDLLNRVSGDRLRHEFNMILAEWRPLAALERLGDLGVLENIHFGLKIGPQARDYFAALDDLRQNTPWPLPEDFDDWRVLAFSFLILDYDDTMLDDLGQRLTLSRRTLDQLRAVRAGKALREQVGTMTPAEVVQHLEGLGMTAWLACWVLYDEAARGKLMRLVTEWRHIHSTLKGDDLLSMGLRPGPQVGQLLHEMRSAWLNGEVANGHEERIFAEGRIRELTTQS